MDISYRRIVIFIYILCNTATVVISRTELFDDRTTLTLSTTTSSWAVSGQQTVERVSQDSLTGVIRAIISSLSVIVVSEIGDKTFFIAAIMAMNHSRCTVFLGAIFALILMSILSVMFGYLARAIPHEIVYYISSALFAIFGAKMVWEGYHMKPGTANEEIDELDAQLRKRDDEAGTATSLDQPEVILKQEEADGNLRDNPNTDIDARRVPVVSSTTYIFMLTFALTFLGEWGDRSQITTIILAARENVYGVLVGAVVGHSLCAGLAVVGGRFVAQKISVRALTIIGGVLFLVFAFSALIFNSVLLPLFGLVWPTMSHIIEKENSCLLRNKT